MKTLACSLCGYVARVDEKATKVTCAECYLAKKKAERALKRAKDYLYQFPEEDKAGALDKFYYKFLRLENLKQLKELEQPKEDENIWVSAQRLRDEGKSVRQIARVLAVSKSNIWNHTVQI